MQSFYRLAEQVDKRAYKEACKNAPVTESVIPYYEQALDAERAKCKRVMKVALLLRQDFKELLEAEGLAAAVKTYFITIRPDERQITFDDFYAIVRKFTERKCITSFQLSFEQKGLTLDTLGTGFHVHIIAQVTQRSKGELLRDTQSTFARCTAANCIDVKPLARTVDVQNVSRYLTSYDSDDGHKIVTKEWDSLWRQKEGLSALYTDDLPIKSTSGRSLLTEGVTLVELS